MPHSHSPSEDIFAGPLPDTANADLLETAADTLGEIISDEGLSVEYLAFFGSQVTGDTHAESDLDVLIVSPAFEGVGYHERGVNLSLKWPVLELPSIDFKALTPDEFALKREKGDNDTINAALSEGVRLTLD